MRTISAAHQIKPNLSPARARVAQAFAHATPDRTPLSELFSAYHPIHWDICGRTVGTDQAMRWDALADGIAWEELIEADAQASFRINKFFGFDMVRLPLNQPPDTLPRDNDRPLKTGPQTWRLHGAEYVFNERRKLIQLAHPGDLDSHSQTVTEEAVRAQIEQWDAKAARKPSVPHPIYRRVRQLAEGEGIDWVYMGEVGAGTGAAFYPPFMLMWMLAEPDLYRRWLAMQKAGAFQRTREAIAQGQTVIAIGGDVSCDKGPFISPALYHEFILPVIREQVQVIHAAGALAVYTSDGNHWPIKEDFFFNSGCDGCLEVDKAAGMTFERLIAEGIDKKVCIIGNVDARHTLCQGTPEAVRQEVIACLKMGQQSPGGHILHTSQSVHDDVKIENYYAMVNAYREYFGMEALPG